MLNSLLKRALGLERTVIEGARIEGDSIIVSVRPRRAAPRCPVCGRRCAAYDRLGPRRWRAPDLGAARCYLEHAPVRASCPEHGVRTAPVPWARCASSRFASAFEDWVAWLALHIVSVNLFFTSFAKQARRSRKGGFTGCANVFSPIPVTA